MATRIRKGDTVEVRAGKNKGVRGTVLTVHVQRSKVIVENVNVVKRHQKPNQHRCHFPPPEPPSGPGDQSPR